MFFQGIHCYGFTNTNNSGAGEEWKTRAIMHMTRMKIDEPIMKVQKIRSYIFHQSPRIHFQIVIGIC